MSKLQWDLIGERLAETGTEKGVVYPIDPVTRTYKGGVAWNGLTAVNEAPEGAEPTTLWADDIEYMSLYSKEKYKATVEAFMYPDEIAECDGTAEIAPGVRVGQQSRKSFGFSFKSLIVNDTEGDDYGYKIHLVYGCKIAPSSKDYGTVNDSPEGATFSWEMTTTPVSVNGLKPSATVVIDSTKVDKEKLKQLEDILYGTDTTEPRLPLPDEVAELMATNPLTLNIDANIAPDQDLFGKVVSDLQQDVAFTANAVAGTLKYVDDYTGFSGDPELQKGNYIVFHANTVEPDAKITVKITDPVVLDEDRIFVGRIANKDVQTITVTAEKEGFTTVTKVYSLSALICEQPEG